MTSTVIHNAQDLFYAGRKRSFLLALVYMGLTFFILTAHAVLGAYLGLPGFIWIVLVTVVALFTRAELAFTLVIVALFMQNTFVALAAPAVTSLDNYNALMATSFLSIVLTALFCLPIWLKLRNRLPADNRELLKWLFILLGMVVIYSLIGAAQASLNSVLTYTRIYFVGAMLLAIGIAFGFQMSIDYAVSVIRLLTIFFVLWGFTEFFFDRFLYGFFNIAQYLSFKYATPDNLEKFENISDVITFSSRAYLNLSGMMGLSVEMLRPNGPNLHPISFAYYLTFCGLTCFIYRAHFLTLTCFLLAILIGAKGPLILMTVSILLYAIYATTRSIHILMIGLFTCMGGYLTIGIIYGIMTADYHVVGFLGGVNGFFHNPIGHGIGVGGSISTEGQEAQLKDYESFQQFGASYAFDSAIGVMLYQIGICSLIFFIFCKKLWKSIWGAVSAALPTEPRLLMVPITLGLLLVNGIFQEEALSPAGWGPWLLFSGFLLARHWRQQQYDMDQVRLPKAN